MSERPGPEKPPESPPPAPAHPEQMPDLSEQVPDLKILEGEKVVVIQETTSPAPRKTPSSLREMHRLVGAKPDEHFDDVGPVMASQPLAEGEQAAEYRRYEALFGRDALRVAADLLPYYPKLTRATLLRLAELQGVTSDTAREEEPGRIIHETRDPATDPIARQLTDERGWGWPYYGSVDATIDFVRTIADYRRKTATVAEDENLLNAAFEGRDGKTHTMADALEAATDWIVRRMDANPEGLIEYKTPLPRGIENEVWKDSWDAYFHSDGSIANHEQGMSSIEVQSRAYDALLDAAEIAESEFDQPAQAAELRQRAERLCRILLDRFWTDRGGYFALGSDRDEHGQLRPLWVRTSNMGHLLNSRLLEGNDPDIAWRRQAVILNLFSEEMLDGAGIRTLATDEARYRPGAYHNGSVWIWDNYYIATGLRRHGYTHLADELDRRIVNVTHDTRQFPEYVRGDSDEGRPRLNDRVIDIWDENYKKLFRVEQPPQQVQAWSVAATLAIKKARVEVARNGGDKPEPSRFEQEVLEQIRR